MDRTPIIIDVKKLIEPGYYSNIIEQIHRQQIIFGDVHFEVIKEKMTLKKWLEIR